MNTFEDSCRGICLRRRRVVYNWPSWMSMVAPCLSSSALRPAPEPHRARQGTQRANPEGAASAVGSWLVVVGICCGCVAGEPRLELWRVGGPRALNEPSRRWQDYDDPSTRQEEAGWCELYTRHARTQPSTAQGRVICGGSDVCNSCRVRIQIKTCFRHPQGQAKPKDKPPWQLSERRNGT